MQRTTTEAKRKEARPEGLAASARARTCVGCQGHEDVREPVALVRLVLGPGGVVAVDAGSSGFGRGAYVHARASCLSAAVAKGLPRAARSAVFLAGEPGSAPEKLTAEALAEAIVVAMDRRIEGLLASAVRTRSVALGADAVTGACQRGEAELVVVACDAQAAAELGEVRRAVADGRAVAWGTKASLARALEPRPAGVEPSGRLVGVLAVTSEKIGAALRASVHGRDACASVRASEGAVGQNRSRRAGGEPVVVGRSSVERGS